MRLAGAKIHQVGALRAQLGGSAATAMVAETSIRQCGPLKTLGRELAVVIILLYLTDFRASAKFPANN